jgi:hypothetical protein
MNLGDAVNWVACGSTTDDVLASTDVIWDEYILPGPGRAKHGCDRGGGMRGLRCGRTGITAALW